MKVFRLIAAILVALALAPAASAHADRVDGGVMRLKLSSGMRERLAKEGVRLVGLKPAKAGRSGLALPISSGGLDLKAGRGSLDLEGGFKLVAGKRSVKVVHLVLFIGKRVLTGTISGGRRIEVARFPAPRATYDGFNLDLRLNWFKPSPQIAPVFNSRLGIGRTFSAGRSLGSAAAVLEFEMLTVRGGEITLAIDPGFEDRLNAIEATLRSSGTAKFLDTSPTVISIPIDGDEIAPDIPSGMLSTEGGLAISQHDEPFDHVVALFNANVLLDVHLITGLVSPYPSPPGPFSGVFAVLPYLGTSIRADPSSGEISSPPLPVAFHSGTSKAMNEVLGAPKGHPEYFASDEIFGTLSFRVQTR